MAFRSVRPRPFMTEQDTNDPNEQVRDQRCFGCDMLLMNLWKMSTDEPRWICRVLDLENRKIEAENESIINPLAHKALKQCPRGVQSD